MRTESEKTKLKWFIGGLFVIALMINSVLFRPASTYKEPQPHRQQFVPQPPQASQTHVETTNEAALRKAADDAAAARQAVQEAAAQHQQFLARYLNPDHTRKLGAKTVALAVVSEADKFNRAVGSAISSRFKPEGMDIFSSLFTPEFVSDGLFNKTFDDPSPILKKLELLNSIDFLLLAREQVQYSQDPSLENIITANMQLEVMMLPVAAPDNSQTWTLSANGAGFTQKDARSLAEERLVKQIAKDPKMSLTPPVTNH